MKRKKYLIDTNYFIRALTNDDEIRSPIAQKFFLDLQLQNFEAQSDISVIAEVVYVLTKSRYLLSRSETTTRLSALILIDNLEIYLKLIVLDSLAFFANSKLDFVDCYLLTLAKEMDLELITFDLELAKLI